MCRRFDSAPAHFGRLKASRNIPRCRGIFSFPISSFLPNPGRAPGGKEVGGSLLSRRKCFGQSDPIAGSSRLSLHARDALWMGGSGGPPLSERDADGGGDRAVRFLQQQRI